MLKTAQWRDPPTETRARPATVVPMPVCSGWRAAEREDAPVGLADLVDDVAHLQDLARSASSTTVSAAMRLATSPAAWPPMPSATT